MIKKIKNISALSLIVLIIFFLIFSFVSVSRDTPKDVMTINYTFMVKDGVGFNLDTDKLNFGGGPINATLERTLDLSSLYDAQVHIETQGPGNLYIEENDFFLPANYNKTIMFNLNVPRLPLGLYEGVVYIEFYER